jgi:rhomboid protease GluP
MWGLTGPVGRLLRKGDFTSGVIAACVALYVASLLLDPAASLRPRGPFEMFSPGARALDLLGMTGSVAWEQGRWWTLLTAIYLHGNVFHILFNVLWIRQLGPAVHELYGGSRLVMIFTVAGIAGFVASNAVGVPFTIGASGSIFGLLGAMVAYGRHRGGTFGRLILSQYGQWALLLFVFGFLMSGVNNFAHAGGFAGGLVLAWLVAPLERRSESEGERWLAAALIGLTLVAFGLALWTALI